MDRTANWAHWEALAREHGTALGATTRCWSIKRLEIEALLRRLPDGAGAPTVLELGCGNGVNGFFLVERHPGLRYLGLDFSPAMIEHAAAAARRRAAEGRAGADRIAFGAADARALDLPLDVDRSGPHFLGAEAPRLPAPGFDVVFTDRMLINLASSDEQLAVMERIAGLVRPGGRFLMLENSARTHGHLNRVRGALGLPPRPPAAYNVFIDEERVIEPFRRRMQLLGVDDFAALHDLLLYAVAPAAATGEVEYDTPLMARLTDALLALQEMGLPAGDGFGQNRLWVWQGGAAP